MSPDLVLSDVMMPVMNGFELLNAIRKDVKLSDIPIILLSARAGKEATIEGLERGANDYLTKPFYADELIARVSTQLQLKRTERVNSILRESERKFKVLAESIPEKVWSCNTAGKLVYCNPGMLAYTGLDYPEQAQWTDFIHPDEINNIRKSWQNVRSGAELLEFECRLRNTAGSYQWHLARVVPETDSNGQIRLWIGTFTNINDHKLFQEELERRVKDRTTDLIHINAELEQFAFAASHDLQEPLRKITIYSQLLENELSADQGKVSGYLDKILTSAARMRNLINDLLNFSRLSTNEMEFTSTDLNVILGNLLIDLELQINKLQAKIICTGLPVIEAVPLQMQQLFFNLLANALKFVDNSRTPVISIHFTTAGPEDMALIPQPDPSTTYFRILVTDNGIGFDQKYAGQIFTMFQKLHNRGMYAGTGIGLALCKKVMINHHGAIYASSVEGQGTTFTIILPSRQPEKL
jgi:PAS domain S-box-containing protein